MADDAAFNADPDVLTAAAQGRLKSFVERIERLEEDKVAVQNDLKEVYAEAKGRRLRREDPAQGRPAAGAGQGQARRGSGAGRPLPVGDRGAVMPFDSAGEPDFTPSRIDRLVLAIAALLGGTALFAGGFGLGFVVARS